jgi:hypothetical protein
VIDAHHSGATVEEWRFRAASEPGIQSALALAPHRSAHDSLTLSRRSLCRSFSFAPLGLGHFPLCYPRLAPWALFLRRFAAGEQLRSTSCNTKKLRHRLRRDN